MKKILVLFTLIFALGAVGCSCKSEVKDVSVEDIKAAINNENLLPLQPLSEVDAKEFYVFENVKDNITEGFAL